MAKKKKRRTIPVRKDNGGSVPPEIEVVPDGVARRQDPARRGGPGGGGRVGARKHAGRKNGLGNLVQAARLKCEIFGKLAADKTLISLKW